MEDGRRRPCPSHSYYTADEIIGLMDDDLDDMEMDLEYEPMCDGSDDDLQPERER